MSIFFQESIPSEWSKVLKYFSYDIFEVDVISLWRSGSDPFSTKDHLDWFKKIIAKNGDSLNQKKLPVRIFDPWRSQKIGHEFLTAEYELILEKVENYCLKIWYNIIQFLQGQASHLLQVKSKFYHQTRFCTCYPSWILNDVWIRVRLNRRLRNKITDFIVKVY